MSIAHRAFVFDTEKFASELSPMLMRSLEKNNVAELKQFISEHADILKDLCSGEALTRNWEDGLETRDAHQYGDVALTKYYDPNIDIGLGEKWLELDRLLESDKSILLGKVLGPDSNPFDPGKLGSYFQTAADLASSLTRLDMILDSNPMLRPTFSKARRLLQSVVDCKLGMYVTF